MILLGFLSVLVMAAAWVVGLLVRHLVRGYDGYLDDQPVIWDGTHGEERGD